MNLRTPLARVRGLGSAKSGTEHWWHQRLTAIANLPLSLFVVGFIVCHLGASRAEIIASLHNPVTAIGLGLAIISFAWHMRLGLQVVIEDYIHGAALKLAALLTTTFIAAALVVAGLYAILKMSLGL
ncbi:MAG: succinate dehydrogenase, hydrophobic membrane anchor protein [Alphaproteobacteria bacterium]|nr:succinate dehydrogenase, hydrophobic membrane anchor protein [Alphaproteobacteria bacterium]